MAVCLATVALSIVACGSRGPSVVPQMKSISGKTRNAEVAAASPTSSCLQTSEPPSLAEVPTDAQVRRSGRAKPQASGGAGVIVDCSVPANGSASITLNMAVDLDPNDGPDTCGPVTWATPAPDGILTVTESPSVTGSGNADCNRLDAITVDVNRADAPTPSPSPGSLVDVQFVLGTDTETNTSTGFQNTESPSVSVYVIQPTPLPIRILDCETRQFVDGETIDAVDGRQMHLRMETAADPTDCAASPAPLSSPAWNVPNSSSTTVADYSETKVEASIAPLTQFSAQDLIFYWTAMTNSQISAFASLNGQPTAASTTVDVLAPTTSITAAPTSSPVVDQSYTPNYGTQLGGWTLHYGQDLSPSTDAGAIGTGITWTFDASAPNARGAVGKISMLQLEQHSYTGTNAKTGTSETIDATGGLLWPDGGCLQYQDYAVGIAQGGSATWQSNDAPALFELTPSYSSVTDDQSFKDYFIYKPQSPSIWVTLAIYAWSFSATANAAGSAWELAAGSTASHDPAPSASSVLPTWSGSSEHNASICP